MLYKALKILNRKDTDQSRQIFYQEYLKQSVLRGLIVSAYGRMPLFLKSIVLVLASLAKMMKCSRLSPNKKTIAIYWTMAEEKRCREILTLLRTESTEILPVEEKNWKNYFLIYLFLNRRCFGIARLLAKKYDFLVAARSLETIFYYIYFKTMLKKSECRRVLACSNVNPYALGFFSAAKSLGLKTIYANHGRIHGFTPEHFCDYNLLTYLHEDLSAKEDKVVLHTGLQGNKPGKVTLSFTDNDAITVGIILSMTPSLTGLNSLISDLLEKFPRMKVVLKHHPIKEYNYLPALRKLSMATKGSVTIDQDQSLDAFMHGKTFFIGANTNAHIDCLMQGRATLYYAPLDLLPPDFYGFVRHGLVMQITNGKEVSSKAMNSFYEETWEKTFAETYFSDQKEVRNKLAPLQA